MPKCCVCNVQIQTAGIFLVGCPACNQNFKHFFCTITCSADQSLFTNVTSAQKAYDNNKTVVEAIDVFVSDTYGQLFYNSCKVGAHLLSLALQCVFEMCAYTSHHALLQLALKRALQI